MIFYIFLGNGEFFLYTQSFIILPKLAGFGRLDGLVTAVGWVAGYRVG